MQRLILLLLFAEFGVNPAYAQQQRPDHLMPEDSLLTDGSSNVFSMSIRRYNELITDFLADGYARDVSLRALVIPAFSPENLVGLRHANIEGGDDHRVFYLRPTIPLGGYAALYIWSSDAVYFNDPKDRTDEVERLKSRLPADPKDVPLTRCERPLDAAVAEQVSAAWIGVLLETRYLPADNTIGRDGVTYHFWAASPPSHISPPRFLAGQSWSPPRDSKPGRLAELAETLVRYCDGKTEAAELERQAGALAQKLDK
ncbi:hypothetical protein TSA1_11300 [Bradyrhizobium nitroreducens]|uniref:Uncharacterized protein n=1 Tax=Bradyrhizobium nitroreducens TaxID=709803 RepID=A0A2M6U9M1_9BRAD|nr:hypothetical protein [Bradyrhizobium nitroreducens]PIT01279.1 hypothetical protein TSA1_11300 [Bradyrhizobium nitroreducens]